MTKFLRTASPRRLAAVIGGLVAAIAAGTAIAVAASGPGPVPPHKPLARAVHQGLAAPQVNGISARIKFTNHLIDSSDLQGSDPILSGATGRLWLGDHRLRLELQSDNGDAQIVVNNGSFWAYDPSSNTVYQGRLPAQKADHKRAAMDTIPSVATIQSDINRLARHVNVSGAIPSDVAGRPTYTVKVSPKHDGGLLGAAALAWDAVRGVPLRIAIYARGENAPVLELKATDISYGKVPASDFAVSPPSGAKVVKVETPAGQGAGAASHGALAAGKAARARGRHHEVTGTRAVAAKLPFKLVARKKLDGLTRRSTTLLNWGGKPAALVTYGQNLGGVAVLEQVAQSGQQAQASGDHRGLSLPTVSINGATGQELATALGTMVRFTRAGVTYTVIGSVPPAAAELAARAL
jgi:outer membrane lipoprotein-sorting protein